MSYARERALLDIGGISTVAILVIAVRYLVC